MALAWLIPVGVLMLLESRVSLRHERALRARGAREPDGDVYRRMQVAYPGGFVLMAIEGLMRGSASHAQLVMGIAVFAVAKALKYWAIVSLGPLWSFRVLVVPGAPLVTSGPYRFVRHPNYIAVMGEFIGGTLLLNAPVIGTLATILFALLIRRRVAIEEKALLDP
jgi:methyltransferase